MLTLPALPAARAAAKALIFYALVLLKRVAAPLAFQAAERQSAANGCNAKRLFSGHPHSLHLSNTLRQFATRCKAGVVGVFFGLVLFAPGAFAQYTQVRGTITDAQGVPYAGATIKAQIVLPQNFTGQPTVPNNSQAACIAAGLGNAPCRVAFDGTHGPISLRSEGHSDDGHFSIQVENTSQVLPAGSQWLFTVEISPGCVEPWGFGPRSFTYQTPITGSSVDLSTPLSAVAPLLCRQVAAGATTTVNTFSGAVIIDEGRDIVIQNATNTVTVNVAEVALRHVCEIIVGADNGSALSDADIAPQGQQCWIPADSTLLEIGIASFSGTPSVVLARDRNGTIANILSSALATTGAGAPGYACANTGGTVSLNGTTTCSATLQNTALLAGDFLETVSATAGGVTPRVSIQISWAVN